MILRSSFPVPPSPLLHLSLSFKLAWEICKWQNRLDRCFWLPMLPPPPVGVSTATHVTPLKPFYWSTAHPGGGGYPLYSGQQLHAFFSLPDSGVFLPLISSTRHPFDRLPFSSPPLFAQSFPLSVPPQRALLVFLQEIFPPLFSPLFFLLLDRAFLPFLFLPQTVTAASYHKRVYY